MSESQSTLGVFGLIVVDPAGRVRFSNAQAAALLAKGDTLFRSSGGMLATSRHGREGLQRLLRCTLEDAAADAAAVPRVVPLPRPGHLPLIAIALPISGSRRQADFELGAVIVLRDPEQVHFAPKPIVREMFGLTNAEADVALAIGGGGSVLKEIARLRSCSVNTVRTLTGRVFEKTGCRRQAEVVRLLGALNDALAAASGLASGMAVAGAA